MGNDVLQSVHIDDDPQLMLCGISWIYTQLKLKSKAESFENKPLHRYVHKNVYENSNVDQKYTENGQPTSLWDHTLRHMPVLSLNKI